MGNHGMILIILEKRGSTSPTQSVGGVFFVFSEYKNFALGEEIE
jgi:hypothetical protein